MKKIFSILVFFAGLFALAPVVSAQGEGEVAHNKRISPPDGNGVYTISLEAYVTGKKITTETAVAPADIVLVMSYNSSYDETLRKAIHNAVASFVNIVKESNESVQEDDNGGHRVAFVYFGNKKINAGSPFNTFLDVDHLTATAQGPTVGGSVTYDGTSCFPNANDQNGSSYSGDGLLKANSLISDANTGHAYDNNGQDHVTGNDNTQRSRIVVFFTNAAPGAQSMSANWNDTATSGNNQQADICVENAWTLKNSGSYPTVIYSIAVDAAGDYSGNYSPDKFTTWLNYTSSDNTTHPSWVENGHIPSSYVDVTGDYSMITNAGGLEAIFESIASTIGGDYSASSASSVLIDVVSTSFSIPVNADLGSVQVYAVPCTQTSSTTAIKFDDTTPLKEEYLLTTVSDVDEAKEDPEKVYLLVDPDTGVVSVTGFDYGGEWCGWETFADGTGAPHGRKIVLQIPVTANIDAVGGPNVETNAEGSGLTIIDADGNQVGDVIEFISPTVSLPVNIYITKTGLERGESAKFMIQRAFITGSETPDEYEGLDWKYVSTVFVTNDGTNETITKVRGLPAEGEVEIDGETVRKGYLYRISEEGWSWSYSSKTGPQFTDTNHVENPFTFENDKEEDYEYKIRHAESKVTNVFNGTIQTEAVYVDSKNQRTN